MLTLLILSTVGHFGVGSVALGPAPWSHSSLGGMSPARLTREVPPQANSTTVTSSWYPCQTHHLHETPAPLLPVPSPSFLARRCSCPSAYHQWQSTLSVTRQTNENDTDAVRTGIARGKGKLSTPKRQQAQDPRDQKLLGANTALVRPIPYLTLPYLEVTLKPRHTFPHL